MFVSPAILLTEILNETCCHDITGYKTSEKYIMTARVSVNVIEFEFKSNFCSVQSD